MLVSSRRLISGLYCPWYRLALFRSKPEPRVERMAIEHVGSLMAVFLHIAVSFDWATNLTAELPDQYSCLSCSCVSGYGEELSLA